jgi:hypothetical protein
VSSYSQLLFYKDVLNVSWKKDVHPEWMRGVYLIKCQKSISVTRNLLFLSGEWEKVGLGSGVPRVA